MLFIVDFVTIATILGTGILGTIFILILLLFLCKDVICYSFNQSLFNVNFIRWVGFL